ncbi:FadR/GntR family transcriptional regulator [Microbacterium insulae]|uniref:FadR/GntR family transcriptional regulator n=1 Tax=Microbacterium insulae TaxID=483014 RepID=A0ABW3AHQ0_9MICO
MSDIQDRGAPTPRASRAHFEADLVRKIMGGTYAPGTKLPSERILAETSGLSRPVIREVLRGLVERGLIEVIPARGAFVHTPGVMQLAGVAGPAARQQGATPRDLVEARELIEAQSALRAAERATPDDVAQLRELVAAFDSAKTTIERTQCDLALHASIARVSRNPVLGILFGAIAPLVLDVQLRSLADPVVLEQGAPLHHDIVDAIAAGDAGRAAEMMSRHILLALELYGDDLDIPLNDLAVGRLESLLGSQRQLQSIVDEVLATTALA